MNQKTIATRKNLPELKISAGGISVTVWKNETKNKIGHTTEYSTISLQRSYKDTEGNWQTTTQMRLNDLPKAAIALNKAYEHLTFKQDNIEQHS